MKYDIVIGGVGGQGILSIAFVLDNTAMKQDLHFKQSEVHGMAQRGGAVSSHLRISDEEIFSDLVAVRSADLLLSVEPMEALRYRHFLDPSGLLVTSTHRMINIPNYPSLEDLLAELTRVPNVLLLNADKIAKEAGSARAQNMVILGAASRFIPLSSQIMKEFISVLFDKKGDRVIQLNHNAFEYGLRNGQFFTNCMELKTDVGSVLQVMDHLDSANLDPEAAAPWSEVLATPAGQEWVGRLAVDSRLVLPGDTDTPQRIRTEGPAFLETP